MPVWIPLLACSGQTLDDSGTATLVLEELARPEPALTADEVVQGIELMVGGGFADPHEVMDLYLELMALGDQYCPGDLEQMTDTVVYGCDASTGYFYMGVAEYFRVSGGRFDYQELGGDFLIIDPEGQVFEVGAGMAVAVDHKADSAWTTLMGTITWDAHTGWMHSVSAIIEGRLNPATTDGILRLDGGLRVEDSVLDLKDVMWDPATCDDQASGQIGWRGPDQRWYVAQLECGCGPLDFEGQDLGEVCVDLTGISAELRDTMLSETTR
ncbi:MAG: hypothetical protein GY913_10270 [Proteobacteria bacterium]|nr:hypothetical protein [Pseudomonadota bacterium]MCP4917297.1 hypothetical protein [Pseudomonadota bacterium]